MATIEEVRRIRMWQDEGRVVTCDYHITGFSNIEKIYDVRRKIGCSFKNCSKDGRYEVELKF